MTWMCIHHKTDWFLDAFLHQCVVYSYLAVNMLPSSNMEFVWIFVSVYLTSFWCYIICAQCIRSNHSYYESLHLHNILHEVPYLITLMWFTPSENTLVNMKKWPLHFSLMKINIINQIHHLSGISIPIIFTLCALINQMF